MEDVLYQQSQGVNLNKKLQLRIFILFFVNDYKNFSLPFPERNVYDFGNGFIK